MEKSKKIALFIMALLILVIIGEIGYIVYTQEYLINNKPNLDAVASSAENEEVDSKKVKDLQIYLNNSIISKLLEKKEEDTSNMQEFFNKYDNQEKMLIIINELDKDATELTKTNIEKKSKEIFGFSVKLKFEDIACPEEENEKNVPALYKYNKEEESYSFNDYHAHGSSYIKVYNKIIEAKKKDNYYEVLANVMYEMDSEGIAFDFYKDSKGDKVVKRFSDGTSEPDTEESIKYFDLLDSYEPGTAQEFKEKMVELLFTEDIKDKLNTYKFKIKDNDGRYEIVSFEKV